MGEAVTPAPLPGSVQAAANGALGFDADATISAGLAADFAAAGFTFAVRYVHRAATGGDLTQNEAQDILNAGLGLMVVQHVETAPWTPDAGKGTRYGQAAATNAAAAGLAPGTSVWLDLEGVAAAISAADVVAYCNAWFAAVSAGGYVPGLYVGANCMLDGAQLYDDLTTQYYWKSGSSVPAVATRGYCMVQTISSSFVVSGCGYDKNVVQTDALGNTPLVHMPASAAAATV